MELVTSIILTDIIGRKYTHPSRCTLKMGVKWTPWITTFQLYFTLLAFNALLVSDDKALFKCVNLTNRVAHICVCKLGHHWFRKLFVTSSARSYYLYKCWLIVNWKLWNILPWNLWQNKTIFTEENEFENVVCKMSSIWAGPDIF